MAPARWPARSSRLLANWNTATEDHIDPRILLTRVAWPTAHGWRAAQRHRSPGRLGHRHGVTPVDGILGAAPTPMACRACSAQGAREPEGSCEGGAGGAAGRQLAALASQTSCGSSTKSGAGREVFKESGPRRRWTTEGQALGSTPSLPVAKASGAHSRYQCLIRSCRPRSRSLTGFGLGNRQAASGPSAADAAPASAQTVPAPGARGALMPSARPPRRRAAPGGVVSRVAGQALWHEPVSDFRVWAALACRSARHRQPP